LLREQDAQAEQGSNKKLHLDLALLPVDATKAGELRDRLQIVSPSEFVVVRDFLPRYLEANVFATTVVQPLWKTALDTSGCGAMPFRCADPCAEKRMAFWHALMRHLSVVSRRSRNTFEISG
jgi:hypothetical protein